MSCCLFGFDDNSFCWHHTLYFILVYCLFHDLPTPPPFTVCLLFPGVTFDLFTLSYLFSLSHTNCLPLRRSLPCLLATFLFSLSLRCGWQRANICVPSHVVCVTFLIFWVPAALISRSHRLIFSHTPHSWCLEFVAVGASLGISLTSSSPPTTARPCSHFTDAHFSLLPCLSLRVLFPDLSGAVWSSVACFAYQIHQRLWSPSSPAGTTYFPLYVQYRSHSSSCVPTRYTQFNQ